MTTKLNQIFANLKAAIMDVKKTEGDANKIDSLKEVSKIGELLANAEIEIGDVLEKEQTNLKKHADSLSHSQYTNKESELREMQQTAYSKIEEVRFALDAEKETLAAALPKYQYYDDADGQVKNIKNLHSVRPDGGYEVRDTNNADGSYTTKVYNAKGQEYGMKLYNKDGEPTDMKKAAEYFGLKSDGFLNRLGAILFDIIPMTDHDSASILAELGENEYVRNRDVYRWNAESAQFDKVRSYPSRHDWGYVGTNIDLGPDEKPFTLDEAVDNLTGAKSLEQIADDNAKAELVKSKAAFDEVIAAIDSQNAQIQEILDITKSLYKMVEEVDRFTTDDVQNAAKGREILEGLNNLSKMIEGSNVVSDEEKTQLKKNIEALKEKLNVKNSENSP